MSNLKRKSLPSNLRKSISHLNSRKRNGTSSSGLRTLNKAKTISIKMNQFSITLNLRSSRRSTTMESLIPSLMYQCLSIITPYPSFINLNTKSMATLILSITITKLTRVPMAIHRSIIVLNTRIGTATGVTSQ